MTESRYYKRFKRAEKRTETIGQNRLNYPFAMFVSLMPYMTQETISRLVLIPPPKTFHKKPIDDTLQLVTFGTLVKLQKAPTNDYLQTCCKLVEILTDTPADIVASSQAYAVLGVVNMISSEMERIGKLFQSIKADLSADEISAGADRLEFGTFGLVDWYAKRMGITDHEEVFATPWARIYQCMKIDHENNEFEKRYRKIIENKQKVRSKR